MSVAFTRGIQGRDLRDGVLASAKHFLGYGVTEAGQNMAATAVGARELYDVYAHPFEAAIRLAGLGSVMASYSEFDGVPIHISPPDVMAAMNAALKADLKDVMNASMEEYVRSRYSAVSLADAIPALVPQAEVTVAPGAGVVPSQPTDIPSAVAAAQEGDVVILAVGGQSAWFGNEVTEGEGKDTANIDLPAQQVELIHVVTAVGKPTVAVLSMGHPYALGAVVDRLPAILTAYYGGPQQGPALADAIFGVTNPGGKLPFTLPRHVGQMPIHHAQKWGSGYRRTAVDIHKGYLDMPSTPLFAFGHGLSYTTFAYTALELDADTIDIGGELRASITVTNSGKRAGTEIVQVYVADTATGLTLPAQQLVGFARVDLEPGASKTLSFAVPMSLLAYTGLSGELVMEPGPIEVSVGSSSSDIRSTARFEVTGRTRTIRGDERAFLSAATIEPAAA